MQVEAGAAEVRPTALAVLHQCAATGDAQREELLAAAAVPTLLTALLRDGGGGAADGAVAQEDLVGVLMELLRWEQSAYPPTARAATLEAAEAVVRYVTGREEVVKAGVVRVREVAGGKRSKKPCTPAACKQLCGLLACLIDDMAVLRHEEAQDQVAAVLAGGGGGHAAKNDLERAMAASARDATHAAALAETADHASDGRRTGRVKPPLEPARLATLQVCARPLPPSILVQALP